VTPIEGPVNVQRACFGRIPPNCHEFGLHFERSFELSFPSIGKQCSVQFDPGSMFLPLSYIPGPPLPQLYRTGRSGSQHSDLHGRQPLSRLPLSLLLRRHVERSRLHISRPSCVCRPPCVVLAATATKECPTLSTRTQGIPSYRKPLGFPGWGPTLGGAGERGQATRWDNAVLQMF
jgi:hypothetical protein